jgi:hypothetical protein
VRGNDAEAKSCSEQDRWTFYENIKFEDLVKSQRNDGFAKSSSCKARKN